MSPEVGKLISGLEVSIDGTKSYFGVRYAHGQGPRPSIVYSFVPDLASAIDKGEDIRNGVVADIVSEIGLVPVGSFKVGEVAGYVGLEVDGDEKVIRYKDAGGRYTRGSIWKDHRKSLEKKGFRFEVLGLKRFLEVKDEL